MSKHKSNVGITGKEPESPQLQIPKHLYGLLQEFKNEYTPKSVEKRLMQMLIEAQLCANLSGKEYARMTELVFSLILLTDCIDKSITGDFEDLKSVA